LISNTFFVSAIFMMLSIILDFFRKRSSSSQLLGFPI
jgi:hypothetical protein